jgi:hypothetical protein
MSWEKSVIDFYDNWYEHKSPLQDMDWFIRQKEKERLIKVQKELDRLRAKRPVEFKATSPTKSSRKKKSR